MKHLPIGSRKYPMPLTKTRFGFDCSDLTWGWRAKKLLAGIEYGSSPTGDQDLHSKNGI